MGIRGHLQTTQPEYNGGCISNWISHAAFDYLEDKGVNIWTEGDYGSDSEHWGIEIEDRAKIGKIAKYLHEHTDALDKYFDGDTDLVGHGSAEDLACLLDEGIRIADEKGYEYINIDWF